MIRKLTSLVRLCLINCLNIMNTLCEVGSLPDSLSHLHELKRIELSGYTNLMSIPNLPQNIEQVTTFNCENLVKLPSNMSEFQSLTELNLDGCLKLEPEGFMKVTGLRNLEVLSMRNCNVSQVSNEIGNLVSLRSLDLSQNSFSNLPDSFSNLSKLVELKINDCNQLQLLPLLPSNLTRIKASKCRSLDVIRYDSVKAAYIFRSKMLEESFFTKPLKITLSVYEVPEWCSYRSNGDALSFVAPMQHLDNKICGLILCLTSIEDNLWYFSPTILNKTKETSHSLHSDSYSERCSMCVMFCPLNDKTLVVEAGDTVLLHFENRYSAFILSGTSCGSLLIYESDVVDSELCIRTPVALTVPLEMTDHDASITQLYDDPVFSFPFQDNDQYIYHNSFPENLSNDCFETTLVLPSVMMTTAGARITELDDDHDHDYELHL